MLRAFLRRQEAGDALPLPSDPAAALAILRGRDRRLLGGWLGALRYGTSPASRMVGVALLPQAGVAIGLALVASQRVPEVGDAILAATVAGTIVFELAGPILARLTLVRSGEARAG